MKRFLVAAALCVILCLGLTVVLLLPAISPGRTVVADLGKGAAAFLATASCAWAAGRARGRPRLGWALIALSAGAWTAGEAISSVYEVRLQVAVPFPSWADAAFAPAIPLALVGVVMFWRPGHGPLATWRVGLDGSIVALALVFTAWPLGLKQVWLDATDADFLLRNLLEVLYPVGNILVLTVLILAIRRATHAEQARMMLLVGGIASYSLSSSTFIFLVANGVSVPRTSLLDLGWFAGYLLIALAGLWPSRDAEESERSPYDVWQLALPWLAVVSAGVTAVAMAVSGRQLDPFMTSLVGIGATLLTVSVVLAQRDSLVALGATRLSEATLREVIGRAPSGVARIGADMRVMDANPRFAELMQAEGDQAGRPVRSYFRGAEASRFAVGLLSLQDKTGAAEGDVEVRRAGGSTTWVHWTAAAVEGSDGGVRYYVAMFDDTTARHEQEAAAAASLEVLERLNRLKSEFLQSVSHEFKTALIGIQGFSEFMRDADELDVNDARTYAADIYNDAERLDRMVTEMLALDGVESGGGALRKERVDLDALIRREAASAGEQTHDNNVVLLIEPNLPAVAGDKARLSQVVRTLLDNAVKRSPEGGTISVSAALNGSGVEVSFQDEGVGARSEFDNRLFGHDDLYANNPIRKVVGTELSLGIARRVVEMHEGRFWVDGGGSVFHFSVPVAVS